MTESEIWETLIQLCANEISLKQAHDKLTEHIGAINEIENQMERWHHGRDNDAETLQEINDILVRIGRLEWFNKL